MTLNRSRFSRPLLFLILIACSAEARAEVDWPKIKFTAVASGVTNPVQITSARDGTNRLFVVSQSGTVLLKSGSGFAATPFLNISDRVIAEGERGLLSIAFPPNYATSQHFYANYVRASDNSTVISRFGLTNNANVADASSEQIVLTIAQPFEGHKGGQLQFGPDGFLYIGTGDGGSFGDPGNRAQNPRSLLGKMLRIDVESGAPTYRVPHSNPFVGHPPFRREIWALGFRNPWRFSFDRETGGLYVADVGQDKVEEIDFQRPGSDGGENYGWRIKEGNRDYNAQGIPPRKIAKLKPPVATVRHPAAESLIGGFVYRGTLFPRMQGIYFFADFITGPVFGLKHDRLWRVKQLEQTAFHISGFGEDEAGELYFANLPSGTIYHVEDSGEAWTPTSTPAGGTFPHAKRVTLRTSSAGALIHYTLNGTDPVETDPSVSSGGVVHITQSATLKARAFRSGLTPSGVLSATFTINP